METFYLFILKLYLLTKFFIIPQVFFLKLNFPIASFL